MYFANRYAVNVLVDFRPNDEIISVFTSYLFKKQVHEIKYLELVYSAATESKLQKQLGGGMITITMCISRNLKKLAQRL